MPYDKSQSRNDFKKGNALEILFFQGNPSRENHVRFTEIMEYNNDNE